MTSRTPSHNKSPSSAHTLANGVTSPSHGTATLQSLKRSPGPKSLSKLADMKNLDASLDPEALFTQYTVSEVKIIQNRLRADADAKQEDLRQMVGERYRDLLQASTSIIDISQSSKRVINILSDTVESIQSQDEPTTPQRKSLSSKDGNDVHLHTLQILAAHVKLLLDAPEHLWRLIEMKKFYSAAWFFQLSSVVHQALLRDEEESWTDYGIDIEEQYPLVERQWEIVKPFRQQIIHKATLSLRDCEVPAENACSTLLTLHLLDRKPLGEAFSSFLLERSKALQLRLSWRSSGSSQANGQAHDSSKGASNVFRRVPVRETKDAAVSVLSGVSSTLDTSRVVFFEHPQHRALILQVLESIQSESAHPDLPEELRLTTESILTGLPSSSQLLMLPPNLRGYKPHVNISSSSATLTQTDFSGQLEGWFENSCHSLRKALNVWFSELQSLREVWNVREAIWKWMDNDVGLGEHEADRLEAIFETACRQRIMNIWKTTLSGAQSTFQEQLEASVRLVKEDQDSRRSDCSPVDFMFTTPPLPIISHSSSVVSDSSFQKYQATLRRQLLGRSNLLDALLQTVETCAHSLKQDLAFVLSGHDEDNGALVEQFNRAYKPEVQALCNNIVSILDRVSEQIPDSNLQSLLFVCRVASDLSGHSTFLLDLGCGDDTELDFRRRTFEIQNRIIDRWRKHSVTSIISRYRTNSRLRRTAQEPSPALLESLVALSREIELLGLSRDSAQLGAVAEDTINWFAEQLLEEQALLPWHDLKFLRTIVNLVCEGQTPVLDRLDRCIAEREPPSSPGNNQTSVQEYFSRTQLLFAALLPHSQTGAEQTSDKFASLLPHGLPSVDQQYQPAFETAKSSRFGLLLVDSSIVR